MEERIVTDNNGEQIEEPVYTVTKVYRVTPPAEQIGLL
jgi:hypothetical protein